RVECPLMIRPPILLGKIDRRSRHSEDDEHHRQKQLRAEAQRRGKIIIEANCWLLGWKVDMQCHTGFQFHGTLPDIVSRDPSFEQVTPGREMLQAISARSVWLLKIGH